MGIVERLIERERDRDRWLRRAVRLLESDESVVAAWLWGSAGRGDADALSDLDLFVAVADPSAIDTVHERFDTFGEVEWCREVPYNAPAEGRYFTVGYPAAVEPLPIDWYWQPAGVATIGTDTRVLIEKSPLPRVPVDTFATFTPMEDRPSPHPEDPVERLEGLVVWFWSMYGSLAKKIARGQLDQAAGQVRLLDDVLALALDHVGHRHDPISGEPLAALQVLADRMEEIQPALETAGVTSPDTAKARHSLGLAVDLVHAGWRP
jgi:predicted nucleotidyltransferase